MEEGQGKVYPCSALCQCESLEPSVEVVRRYANTPYIPQGTSWLLYLDLSTLPKGVASTQFPPDCLHLWRLLPYSKTEVLLPHKGGEIGIKVYPYTWEVLWESSEEEHHLSNPMSLLIPSSTLLPHLEEGTQTGKESGYNPALWQLQDFQVARMQLECKLNEQA